MAHDCGLYLPDVARNARERLRGREGLDGRDAPCPKNMLFLQLHLRHVLKSAYVYYTILYHIILFYCIVLYCIVLFYLMLFCLILSYLLPFYLILSYLILYDMILYYIILWNMIWHGHYYDYAYHMIYIYIMYTWSHPLTLDTPQKPSLGPSCRGCLARQHLIEHTPRDHVGRRYGLDDFAGESSVEKLSNVEHIYIYNIYFIYYILYIYVRVPHSFVLSYGW
jgi:hypothetical protein